MKAEDLESFQLSHSPILLNPEAATIADVIFHITLGSVEPGPIPKEVATKKNFETSDTYVLEWQQKAHENVRVGLSSFPLFLFTCRADRRLPATSWSLMKPLSSWPVYFTFLA